MHAVAEAAVTFAADIDDAEIAAYVATGEPLLVAGAFTVDSLGGAFIERVDGDPSTVVGMSLSTIRHLTGELGIRWTDLWNAVRGPLDLACSATRRARILVVSRQKISAALSIG